MKYNKGFAPVLVLIIALGVLAVGGVAYFAGKNSAPKNEVSDNSNYFPATEQNYTPPTTNNNPPATSNTNNVTPPVIAKPSITVNSPNGGEAWKRDTTQIIKWSSLNYSKVAYVDIRLVRTNGNSPYTTAYIAKNINISQNTHTWNVGYTYSSLFNPINNDAVLEFPADGQYKIQICETGTNNCDSSNSYFTMTTQDTTSNWKTYTDNKFGYSINYPVVTQINANATTVYFLPTSTKGELSIDVVMSSSASCFNTASGADPTYATINGINFTVWSRSKEYSTGSDTWATAREYCVVHSGSIYKIISKLPYKAGTTPSDVDKDAVLNRMIASFKLN